MWAVLLVLMLCGWRSRVGAEFAAECERLTSGGAGAKAAKAGKGEAAQPGTPSEPSDAQDEEEDVEHGG